MIGKLATPELKRHVLNLIRRRRPEVVMPAAVGEDCAVLNLKDLVLVTCDPITAAEAHAGKLAIFVSANDVAASGGEPVAAFLTVIAPPQLELKRISRVMGEAEATAARLNIEIAGGHTEYSDAVSRLIVCCTMVGVPRVSGKVFSSTNIKKGDSILLTRSVAREYAAIAAGDRKNQSAAVLSAGELDRAAAFSDDLSILGEAGILAGVPGVAAMHDVTEGGVLGALGEVLEASGCGAVLRKSAIAVDDITRKLCGHFGQDPLTAISSGNLLAICGSPKAALTALAAAGIPAAMIGKVTETAGIRFEEETQ